MAPVTKVCGNPACAISTGIHEGLTFGSGELDDHGFWEAPCEACARAWEAAYPEEGPCWPGAGQGAPEGIVVIWTGEINGVEVRLRKAFRTEPDAMTVEARPILEFHSSGPWIQYHDGEMRRLVYETALRPNTDDHD